LNRPFNGGIDEVRVWNVARTQQEILDDMNWELSGLEAGLVGYYRLNEGVGQEIFDGSAYGNHGILGSTAGVDVHDPRWWPSGQTNMAPEVNAGADQVIVWPEDTVNLVGTVSDDGLPAGIVNVQWSKVSGPGTVVFGGENSLTTTATFSMEGTYVLRLTADDTELSASDEVVVAVENSYSNMAPEVNAGADQMIVWPEDTVNLVGTVSDDGLPAGIVNVHWSKVSGPGTVVFGGEDSLTTTATFSMEGTYVLRLTADDTELSSSDEVVVAVVSDSYGYPKSVWLEFDGVDDKAVIGDSASLDITNFITLEAWIRAESIPSSGGQARIVSKSFHYELSLHSADSGCVGGTVGDVQWRGVIGGLDRRICGGSITPGAWHHVAGTYDGNAFTLYVDGDMVASIGRSGLIGTNNYDVNIGNHPTLNRPFNGGIDEVRVWNVARTQQEILDDMNWELSGLEAGLVGYYRLNEGVGQEIFDGSVYGNHGILGSTAGVDVHDPSWWPAGQDEHGAGGGCGCGPDDCMA
jgi:hypothetical protein